MERDELEAIELGDRVWMWLQAENDPDLGFNLNMPTLWRYFVPVGAEL